MADKYGGVYNTVSDPSTHAKALTPADATDLADIPKAIYVGTGGDVTLIGEDAPTAATGVTFKNVPSASILPFRARRLMATGTTAADMLGLY